MPDKCSATKRRKPAARDYCRSIVDMMRPTDERAAADSIMVCMTRDMWQRIYANAKKGAKA